MMLQKFDKISSVPVRSVPTNIITGFLGVGKTSAILQLLKNKPANERWAVLVNEFGEIGIDGSLFDSQSSEQNGVFVREVPGGCMCCTSGIPMQVALTQLLRQAKPDRLLIEPTGLGHPTEVLQTLNSENFRGVIAIQKVVTLIDARQLSDSRYAQHESFQQQVSIADVIVANKCDLYSRDDKIALETYLQDFSLSDVPIVFTEQGVIEASLLNGVRRLDSSKANGLGKHHAVFTFDANRADPHLNDVIPECGFIKALNHGEGFASIGWRFSARLKFDKNTLFAFLSGVVAERLKATFITDDGCFAYNLTRDAITEVPLEALEESRIEIIAPQVDGSWETELFACLA